MGSRGKGGISGKKEYSPIENGSFTEKNEDAKDQFLREKPTIQIEKRST